MFNIHEMELNQVSNQLISLTSRESATLQQSRALQRFDVSNQLISLTSREVHVKKGYICLVDK